MGSGEERGAGVARSNGFYGKRPERCFTPAAKLGKEFGEAFGAVCFPDVEDRCGKRRMAQKNARELETGVTGDAHNGDLALISHFTRASIFFWRDSRDFLLGVIMSTASSPALGPACSATFA